MSKGEFGMKSSLLIGIDGGGAHFTAVAGVQEGVTCVGMSALERILA